MTTLDQKPASSEGRKDQWSQMLQKVGKNQDREAYHALFEHFGPQIKYYAMANGLASHAEELVQETMMQGLKSFHRYKLGTNCKAWLTTIMYNTHYKQIRKLTNLKLVEDKEEIIAQTVPFEPSIPQQVTDEDVLHAIDKVPDTFRDIIVMCDVEGFSYKEIASIMDIPMGTVMSRLHRGRKILRGELAVYAREYGLDVDSEEPQEKVKRKGGESI